MDFERFQREFVVRRDEHNRHFPADQLEHVEAVELRHLHVEQKQIRFVVLLFGQELHRFDAVGALGEDLDAADRLEGLSHRQARRLLVVNDDDS